MYPRSPANSSLRKLRRQTLPRSSPDGATCLGGKTVYRDGRRVGQVGSGGFGHTVGKSLAFAYVEPGSGAPGNCLEVMVLGERRPARVLAEPVYDPASERPRA